jgi:hypothetical protein
MGTNSGPNALQLEVGSFHKNVSKKKSLPKHFFLVPFDLRWGKFLPLSWVFRVGKSSNVSLRTPEIYLGLMVRSNVFLPFISLTPRSFKMQQGLDLITSQNLDGTRRKVSVQVVMVERPI